MKKIFLCLMATLGLHTACGQAGQKEKTVTDDKQDVAVTDSYETDTFTTANGHTVTFHALVHASMRIVYDGKEIQIDPAGQLEQRPIDYTAMPKADKEAIRTLTGEGTQLITNRRCADMLGYGEVMANGDSKAIANDILVDAVPAYNTTEGHTQFHPKGRDNGFVLTFDGLRVYIAGDTEDIPEMTVLKDIDIAFLPCNQPYTMTPEQLTKAARVIRPKVLFPYHYGQTDVTKLPALLKDDGIDVRIRHYE